MLLESNQIFLSPSDKKKKIVKTRISFREEQCTSTSTVSGHKRLLNRRPCISPAPLLRWPHCFYARETNIWHASLQMTTDQLPVEILVC